MPIFSDIIYLNSNENECELVKEFTFKLPSNGETYKGYNLRINEKNQLEFDSTDTVYKIPRHYLIHGDQITIDDLNGHTCKFSVIKREFKKVKEEHFKHNSFNRDTSHLRSIACDIRFTHKEMEWILVGTAPVDMDDRIVMFSKDTELFIFSSWDGQLIYAANFQKLNEEWYVIDKLHVAARTVDITYNEFIERFKFQLTCHLEQRNWIDKWANENYSKRNNSQNQD